MFKPLAAFIGLRYMRAKRRDQFVSFVSAVSMLGMILGVLSLVVVKSVMNGFERELQERILAVVPHGYLQASAVGLKDWREVRETIQRQPEVVGAAPYIGGGVMIQRGRQLKGAQLRAIDPSFETDVSEVHQHLSSGSLKALSETRYGVVLGGILARQLGVEVGDSVTIIIPKVTVTPTGLYPRQRRFEVVGTFDVGAQLDASTLYIHLRDGQKLFQLGDRIGGFQLKVQDMYQSRSVVQTLSATLGQDLSPVDWTTSQGSLFQAVQMEKAMVMVLISIIVLVAAFNIVSILTMLVNEKRGNIAVLRTMGASPMTIMMTFVIQGVALGLAGILVGLGVGVPLALYIGDVVGFIESLFTAQLFDPSVYFISRLPSYVWLSDILTIAFGGMMLSLIATLYPAYQASKISPAEVLRYQ